MPESSEVNVTRRVVTSQVDRPTRWLVWAVFAAVLTLAALVAYALLSGGFKSTTPRTAQEAMLGVTADAIRKNPKNGAAYATRAEALFAIGRKDEAFQALDEGAKACAGTNPSMLYIQRTRTALLNAEGKYAEAVKVGQTAMLASDDYLAAQGAKLTKSHVTGINGNLQTQVSVDAAVQLAAAYMGLKQYSKALEMYDYALKLDPLAGDVTTLRGFAYLAAGNKAKAKADFQQTLQYLPGDPDATRGLKEASK